MKQSFKIVGFGFLLFILTMILLFVLSIVAESAEPIGLWWVSVIIAVLDALCSLWFSRLMRVASITRGFTYGIIWSLMVAGILLIIALPNGTTTIVFGQWPTYLIFIGIAIGPLLRKSKLIVTTNPNHF
jgi:hypothetical protein